MPQPTVTKRLRNPRARSSALASLETLQPRALGFLNRLVTLVSASNLYLWNDNGQHTPKMYVPLYGTSML